MKLLLMGNNIDKEVFNIIKEIIISILTSLIPLIASVYNAKRNVAFFFYFINKSKYSVKANARFLC